MSKRHYELMPPNGQVPNHLHLEGLDEPRSPIKAFVFPAEMFLTILRGLDGEAIYKCHGLPEDARVVGTALANGLPNAIVLFVTSATWALIPTTKVPEAAPLHIQVVKEPGSAAEAR